MNEGTFPSTTWNAVLTSGSFATPAIVLGTAAATGVATTVIRSDGTIAAFDATVPTTSAVGDAAATGSVAFAARRDHTHGRESFATPAIVLGSAAAAGNTTTPIRSNSTIAAFDITAPTTSAVGDAAAVGTVAFAARRDHTHGREGFATNTVTLSTAAGAGVATTLIRSDGVIAAFDATVPSTQAFGDAAAVGVINFASRRDHKHAWPSFATNAIVLGSAAAAGAATTPFRSNDTIAAFDTTAPTTSAVGDAAAVGSIAFAARRDHVHGREAFATNTIIFGSAAAAGAATTHIRSDATIAAFDATTPANVTTAAAATGSAAFAARRDHVHTIGSLPQACAYHSTTQSVNSATQTALVFNSERFDTDTIHSTSSNTGRLTATTAGKYWIHGTISWGTTTGGSRRAIIIRLNGTTDIGTIEDRPTDGTTVHRQEVSKLWSMAANDYVELTVYHDIGSAYTVPASANGAGEFEMAWVGL